MKTSLIAIVTGTVCAVFTWLASSRIAYKKAIADAPEILAERYYEQLRQSIQFKSGYAFALDEIRIIPSSNSYHVQIDGRSSGGEVPMSVDLRVSGGSILSKDDYKVPMPDPKRKLFESELVFLPAQETLEMHVTIHPQNASKQETIIREVPNPVHYHRLLALQLGEKSSALTISIGKVRIVEE